LDTAEIQKISEQFKSNHWPQFLEMLEIRGLRGWTGQTVAFNFPVVAIVGENGTGKSTALKTAACAYEAKDIKKTFYPSAFFLETRWDSVHGVTISYRLKIGDQTRNFGINKPTKKWSYPRKRVTRDVFVLDISRTLPLDVTVGYAKIAKLAASEVSSSELPEEYRKHLSHVLGRDYKNARFATSDVSTTKQVGLLTREFGEISQFHQGAGEDATLDLFRIIEGIPNHSLLIIDEVEASLHPRAQRRLVRFLLWLARQKRIQVILSTHSPYVLEELPLEANILLLPGPDGLSVIYGATPEFALSRIDENVHPELTLFVEDRDASTLLREIIRADPRGPDVLQRLQIAVVGPANVVRLLGQLAHENKLPYKKALGILDGDKDSGSGCVVLPGTEAPERVVFTDLKELNYSELPQRFGVGAGDLFTFLDDAQLQPNHHDWNSSVGNRVLRSSASVWEILCNQWCKLGCRADARKAIMDVIVDTLS
jgi:predicted ATPase